MPQSQVYLHYHFILGTRDDAHIITPEIKPSLYSYIGGILRSIGCRLISANGMPDHVHLLVQGRADRDVAEISRIMKSNSSKWVNETFDTPIKFGWQSGYAAYCVSLSLIPKVKRYIANQEEHHRKMTYAEECAKFFAMYEADLKRYIGEASVALAGLEEVVAPPIQGLRPSLNVCRPSG
jgi:putative transposase